MTSFGFVKLRMRPWFRPTAFRYERTMAKWVGVSFLMALSSTTICSSTEQVEPMQSHLDTLVHDRDRELTSECDSAVP